MEKVIIDSLNINGEGVSFVLGKKVCVKKVLKGEEVEIERVFEKKNFIYARPVLITKKSPMRIEERCKYCEKCGGCDFMFVSSKDLLNIKKEIISDYFKDLYSGDIIENASGSEFNYRNKVSFIVKDGTVGLQERGSKNCVKIDSCIVAKKELNKILTYLQMYINRVKDKNIHHFVVRSIKDEVSVVCVTTKRPKEIEFLNEMLKKRFKNKYGLFINYNKKDAKEILSDKFLKVDGEDFIKSKIFDLEFYVKPYSFMQVNDDVRDNLYNRVAKETIGEVVIEGYSGAGLLSCLIAKKAKRVISIEKNRTATSDANLTKEANNITNLTNINGDCANLLPKLIKENKNATFVIDPPRKGCSQEILSILKEEKVKKIVYVSCNPYTLRQNLVYLKDSYKIVNFEIFDMFPKTSDIECLVVLESR